MTLEPKLVRIRLFFSLLVLMFSLGLAFLMWKLRPETQTRPPRETVLRAKLVRAVPEDRVVTVTTHGVARPTRVVTLASEVAGRVIDMPSRLKAGDRVKAGELLLTVDPVDYEAAVREAEAALARLDASLERLNATEITTKAQLEVTRRSRDLARKDFDRLTSLAKEGSAVSQAVVESSERTLAQAEVQLLQLEQTLELLPSQRLETESERAAAEARLERAKTQLERTTISAPFTGRITRSMVEQDAYLSPGTPLLEMADDRELELHAPVSASELQAWIPFSPPPPDSTWFPPVEPIDVRLEWTGSGQITSWTGTLDRVVSFDATTRTAMLAVRISGDRLSSDQGNFPLSDGMFCRVSIPGRTLTGVFAIPREAVSFDNKVYVSAAGRLRTVDAEVAWSTEDTAFVTGGLQPGDLVVATRLVAPMEGVKLQDLDE